MEFILVEEKYFFPIKIEGKPHATGLGLLQIVQYETTVRLKDEESSHQNKDTLIFHCLTSLELDDMNSRFVHISLGRNSIQNYSLKIHFTVSEGFRYWKFYFTS